MVGAGWAGLAASLDLARAGLDVTLFESAPVAGGRARTTRLDTPLGGFEIDNGQHLMMGAYTETLNRMTDLGSVAAIARSRLELSIPGTLRFRAGRLPAPLHLAWGLATASGLGLRERLAMARMMQSLRRSAWQAEPRETVSRLLHRLGQPRSLIARIWEPLCVGALNTPIESACASTFCTVLRDTLGSHSSASDFVLASRPLGALLPEPALARLGALGAQLRLGTTIRTLRTDESGWFLSTTSRPAGPADELRFDAVVLALPPWSAARLLEALGADTQPLRAYQPEPIATAWALWPAQEALQLEPVCLLAEDPSARRFGQWVFDRGFLDPVAASRSTGARMRVRLAGIVISLAGRLDEETGESLGAAIAAQVSTDLGVPQPAAVSLVTERRATFRCVAGLPRLSADHFAGRWPGLWLAGDWLWPGYPATLEAALRSGAATARSILHALRP